MGFDCIKHDSQITLRVLAALPFIFLLVSFIWYGGHKQLIKSLLSHTNIPLKISVRIYFMLKEKLRAILCKSMTLIWVLEQEKNPTPEDEPNYHLRGLYVKLTGFSGITSSLCESHIDQNITLDLTFLRTKSPKKKKKSINFDQPTHKHKLYYFTSPSQLCILFCKDVGEDGLDNLLQHQMAWACKTKWDRRTSS